MASEALNWIRNVVKADEALRARELPLLKKEQEGR
jgi:hypothetical protein